MFADIINPEECESALKPDFKVENRTTVMITDLACPYDFYINDSYQKELRKYQVLRSWLCFNRLNCLVDSVIIGSFGFVHQALSVS